MPVPKIKIPSHEPSEIDTKIDKIIDTLRDMYYDADDARSAVNIIERYKLNKSQFDYPYGSFEEFKKHTLDGEFDVIIREHAVTNQERIALDNAVKEGKLWVMH